LKENHTSNDIFALLLSEKGNADLYINLQENPQKYAPEKWQIPTRMEYTFRSI
jgi:hypothetical protein